MRLKAILVGLVVVGTAGFARAETNPLSVTVSTNGSWAITFETSVLPKGWFNKGNLFEPTKTTLTAEVTALENSCSNAEQSDARISTGDGTLLTGSMNGNGKNVTGYFWKYEGWDLTNLRNSYSMRYLCDGTTQVRGCDAARPLSLTVSVFDKNGLRTYTDDAGNLQPVTFTVSSGLSLPAYHDAANDEHDECEAEEPDCGIGPCQSACVDACAQGQAGKACREACTCTCKRAVYEATGGVCHANDKCIDDSEE